VVITTELTGAAVVMPHPIEKPSLIVMAIIARRTKFVKEKFCFVYNKIDLQSVTERVTIQDNDKKLSP